jgi:hypothetical protein
MRFKKAFPRLALHQQVALWNRSRALMPTKRTGRPPLPGTLRHDIRHLREALLRTSIRVDIYRLPQVRDLRDHYEELKKHHRSKTATPINAEQLAALLRAAPPQIAVVILLMATASTRHIELTRASTTVAIDGQADCYLLRRVPKRGAEMKPVSVPRTPTTTRVIEAVRDPGSGQLLVAPLRTVNEYIKQMATDSGWGVGRWSSYSIRHGAIAAALQLGLAPTDIILQTSHSKRIPETYLSHRNPHTTVQLSVANALLSPASRVTVPASVCSSND